MRSLFVRRLVRYSPRQRYVGALYEATTDAILDKCLYHDLRVYLPQLLAMEDRMSMAVSLESRVPLLDPRIVELMGRIHPPLQVRGRQPKRLLKGIVRPFVQGQLCEPPD